MPKCFIRKSTDNENLNDHFCVKCLTKDDCTKGTCNTLTHMCVECVRDSNCDIDNGYKCNIIIYLSLGNPVKNVCELLCTDDSSCVGEYNVCN